MSNWLKKTPPLHEIRQQSRLWYAMSAYGSNGRNGSPQWARDRHDAIALPDPKAPMAIQPLWAITHQGHTSVLQPLAQEIKERTDAGYRVVFCNREGSATALAHDLDVLDYYGALPYAAGMGNEWEFGKQITPLEFGRKMQEVAATVRGLGDRYGIAITPPALSSFVNIQDGYGEAVAQHFGGLGNVLLRVHNYRHLDPALWKQYRVAERTREICGLVDDAIVFVEECGWGFSSERDRQPNPAVTGPVGRDFLERALAAAIDLEMPIGPFMNYHEGHHFNDISDGTHGKQRYAMWRQFLEAERSKT